MKDFYNRKDLNVESIVQLIRLWEYGAGESFDDCCSFLVKTDKKFFEFLEYKYPVLHEYVLGRIREDDWKSCSISDMFNYCIDYCTEWIPEGKTDLWNEQYTLAYHPLAEFILNDDVAWETFVGFFTDTCNTCSGTPWIDCYNIRKDFEEWMKRNI